MWSKSFGPPGSDDNAYDVATDPMGNVLVVGYFLGSIDFGLGQHDSAGASDYYLVKLSPAGVPIWSKAFGSGQSEGTVPHIAVDAAGNTYLHAGLFGPTDYGGGALVPMQMNSTVVVKLDPQGNYVWGKVCSSTSTNFPTAIEVDSTQSVLIAGIFEGTFTCAGGMLTSNIGSWNSFVAKLDATGNHVWSKALVVSGTGTHPYDLATDAMNNVYLAGALGGVVDFGGTLLAGNGGGDAFAVRFAPNGAHLWSQKWGDNQSQHAYRIGLDLIGNIFLTGAMNGSVDFGSGVLTTNGSSDGYVVRLP